MINEPTEERNLSHHFRFNLLSLFLIVACAAVWMSYRVNQDHYRQLKNEISGLKAKVGELDVLDPALFASQELPMCWSDKPKWQVWVPDGEFDLCIATSYASPGVRDALYRSRIAPGMRHISMDAVGKGEEWKIGVTVDGQDLPVEMVFPRDKDDYFADNEFGVAAYELFRGQTNSPAKAGQFEIVDARLPIGKLKPGATSKYVMVWIEPSE